jgi:Type IV pilin-like G and H, putative
MFKNSQGKQIINLVITSSLFLVVNPLTTPVLFAETPPQNNLTNPINKDLIGQWEIKDETSGEIVNIIFTSTEKLYFYITIPESKEPIAVTQLGYAIDTNTKPMALDLLPVLDQSLGKIQTIFELTPDKKLKIEMSNNAPNQPRPTKFIDKNPVFTKVSEQAELPKDVKITLLDEQIQSNREKAAIRFIRSLSKAQIAYFGAYQKFTDELDNFLGLKLDQSLYISKINRANRNQFVVSVTAQKPGLRSYTGGIFLVKIPNRNELATMAVICVSDQPTNIALSEPKTPKNMGDENICASGSHLLK